MKRWALALGLFTLVAPVSSSAQEKPARATIDRNTVHVVRPGETLSAIAKRYGVAATALATANGLTRPDRLRVGQKLVLPGKKNPPDPRLASKPPSPPVHFVLEQPSFNGLAPRFIWPVEGLVSSEFGRRRSGWHAGVDIRAEVGTPIFAAAAGTVYYVGWESRYGLVVKIQHPNEFVTVYAHNLQTFVETGDEVYQGQVIATVGRTGQASAYHLHFEIRNNGKVYNPLYLVPEREILSASEATTQPEDDDENAE